MRLCGTWAAYSRGCRCDECRNAAAMVKHRQRHGGVAHAHRCEHCDRTFPTSRGLIAHVGKEHTRRNPRPDHIARLYAAGLGKPLRLRDGETVPCQGRTSVMFPARTGRQEAVAAAVARAQAICAGCHRRVECAELADMRRESDGIWGGIDMFIRYGLTSRARRARMAS